ncbi:MAG: hypothetical protein IK081_03535, partial [Lachnospiraceae bacterium]|nr:hypothetical protein [Lachnospiraceae bacterium]
PIPTEEPTQTEEPMQTETPAPTEAPVQMPEGIPEGFSDQELEVRARAEAQEMQYAYVAESVIGGSLGDFHEMYGLFDYDPAISCNKIVLYYEADGSLGMKKYFQEEKEVRYVIYTPFGVLSANAGESASWSGSSLSYVETDAQGRKTAELSGGYKYFYAYDGAGRLAASRTYEGDQMMEDAVYVYDAKGNLTSRERTEVNDDVVRETAYAYELDENGRIAGVTVSFGAGGMMSNHKYKYEFHYFDNGPVLMVTYDQKGDMILLEHPAYVFLPGAEIKTALETGSGFSYPALEEFLQPFTNNVKGMSSPLYPRFETNLSEYYLYPEEAGKLLAKISQNNNGDSFTTIINRLLVQDEFQMDASVKTSEGAFYAYDGDRLTSWHRYDGKNGSASYRSLKYDSAGRPVEMEFGAENECHFKISYDKAGCVSKILYDYSYYVYECEVKGTITYSHDAGGKLSAINADFSGERMENQKVHMSYSLKLLSD